MKLGMTLKDCLFPQALDSNIILFLTTILPAAMVSHMKVIRVFLWLFSLVGAILGFAGIGNNSTSLLTPEEVKLAGSGEGGGSPCKLCAKTRSERPVRG
jgi:hypothetical protein